VKQLAILGSTGSIGRQCLSVVEALSGQFGVVALAAGANSMNWSAKSGGHKPEVVSVGDAQKRTNLRRCFAKRELRHLRFIMVERECWPSGTHPAAEIVVSAAVGVVGLEATYEAVKLGRTIALSNKESAGGGGELVMLRR